MSELFFKAEDFPLVCDELMRLRAAEHARAKVQPLLERLKSAEEALERLLSITSKSTDMFCDTAVYHTPAMAMRLQADAIERKDAIIECAREHFEKYRGEK